MIYLTFYLLEKKNNIFLLKIIADRNILYIFAM